MIKEYINNNNPSVKILSNGYKNKMVVKIPIARIEDEIICSPGCKTPVISKFTYVRFEIISVDFFDT